MPEGARGAACGPRRGLLAEVAGAVAAARCDNALRRLVPDAGAIPGERAAGAINSSVAATARRERANGPCTTRAGSAHHSALRAAVRVFSAEQPAPVVGRGRPRYSRGLLRCARRCGAGRSA